jgi:dTDP-4-dehydrorhamnose 3,5-epimerase-like enzyme
MIYNEDDRAQRLIDVFYDMPDWQINVSYVNSINHVVAWHRHQIQTDYWVCLKGSFKVGLADKSGKVKFEYLSDKNPRVIKISPGTWHGYKALEPGSILLYGLTEKYDPNDEIRVKPGAFGESWDIEEK